MQANDGRTQRSVGLVLGALLVVAGIVMLVVQQAGFDLTAELGRLGWPIFVILPGLVLLGVGLLLDAPPGVGLAVAGAIVTTVGLVLAYQSATSHWTSWTYAWALVGPLAAGAGLVLWGTLHRRMQFVRGGLGALGVGTVLLVVFFAFFEGLLGLGGERGLAVVGRQLLPLALIAVGLLVIVARLLMPGRPAGPSRGPGGQGGPSSAGLSE